MNAAVRARVKWPQSTTIYSESAVNVSATLLMRARRCAGRAPESRQMAPIPCWRNAFTTFSAVKGWESTQTPVAA